MSRTYVKNAASLEITDDKMTFKKSVFDNVVPAKSSVKNY